MNTDCPKTSASAGSACKYQQSEPQWMDGEVVLSNEFQAWTKLMCSKHNKAISCIEPPSRLISPRIFLSSFAQTQLRAERDRRSVFGSLLLREMSDLPSTAQLVFNKITNRDEFMCLPFALPACL